MTSLTANTILASIDASLMSDFTPLVLDLFFKSLVLFAIVWGATILLKQKSAALRDALWKITFMALFLLPILSFSLPTFQLPFISNLTHTLTTSTNQSPAHTPAPQSSNPIPVAHNKTKPAVDKSQTKPALSNTLAMNPETKPQPAPATVESVTNQSTSSSYTLTNILFTIYCIGLALTLWPVLFGLYRLSRIKKNTTHITSGPIHDTLLKLSKQLKLNHTPILCIHHENIVPLAIQTTPFSRATILLPQAVEHYQPSQLNLVLQHELAHIKRLDCPTQLFCRIIASFYWLNPFVWLGLKATRVEREHACDDLVLTQGHPASEYASRLLEIASTYRTIRFTGSAAVALARPNELESRLLAILDAKRNRGTISTATLTFLFTTVFTASAAIAAISINNDPSQTTDANTNHSEISATNTEYPTTKSPKPIKPLPAYSHKLPSGLTVQLVGIANNRSTPDSWWLPNGMPLKQAPFTSEELGSRVTPNPKQNIESIEVAFTVTGQDPNTLTTSFDVEPNGGGRAGGHRVHLRNQPDVILYGGAAAVKNINGRCDITLHVASESWRTVFESTGNGSRSISHIDSSVIFGDPVQSDTYVSIVVSHAIQEHQVRLVAITRDGQLVTASRLTQSKVGDLRQIQANFQKYKLADIARFQLQVRRYEKVTYKDVSLKRNDRTNVTSHTTQSYKDLRTPEKIRQETEKILNQPVAVSFNGTSLKSAINFIRARSKLNIIVDWQQLEALGVSPDQKITLKLSNTPNHQILKNLLELVSTPTAKVSLTRKVNTFYISALNPKGKMSILDPEPNPDEHSTELLKKLKTPVNMKVSNVPFAQAVDTLAKQIDTTILIHWKSIANAGVKVDKKITLDLTDTPGDIILNLIINEITNGKTKLHYKYNNQYVLIAATSWNEVLNVLEAYNIEKILNHYDQIKAIVESPDPQTTIDSNNAQRQADLNNPLLKSKPLTRVQQAENLIKYISTTIAGQDALTDTGGVLSIQFHNNKLIVNASKEHHAAIKVLLEKLAYE